MKRSAFDAAVDYAISRAEMVYDIRELPAALRAVALVQTAQGVLDNGGLEYFFENDFPGRPSYQLFIEAYQAIGAEDAAITLKRAVELFPFNNPHLKVRKRNRFLCTSKDAESGGAAAGPFAELTQRLCGNARVRQCLRKYVEAHAKSFHVTAGNAATE